MKIHRITSRFTHSHSSLNTEKTRHVLVLEHAARLLLLTLTGGTFLGSVCFYCNLLIIGLVGNRCGLFSVRSNCAVEVLFQFVVKRNRRYAGSVLPRLLLAPGLSAVQFLCSFCFKLPDLVPVQVSADGFV